MLMQSPDWLTAVKLIMIFLVLLMTGPVATHALARAAIQDNLDPLIANKSGKLTATSPDKAAQQMAKRIETHGGNAPSNS
jgi:multisubunit Na+/H+ antiporter MnhG subunit